MTWQQTAFLDICRDRRGKEMLPYAKEGKKGVKVLRSYRKIVLEEGGSVQKGASPRSIWAPYARLSEEAEARHREKKERPLTPRSKRTREVRGTTCPDKVGYGSERSRTTCRKKNHDRVTAGRGPGKQSRLKPQKMGWGGGELKRGSK